MNIFENDSSSSCTCLIYRFGGFDNVLLEGNNIEHNIINNRLIKSVCINTDKDTPNSLSVKLKKGVSYDHNKKEINSFVWNLFFSFLYETDFMVSTPYLLPPISDNRNFMNMGLTSSINMIVSKKYKLEEIYKNIFQPKLNFKLYLSMYKSIFSTLENPNLVAQFLILYQFLLEILSPNKKKQYQSNVTDYFKNNKNKYPYITFHPKRKKTKNKEMEDYFTHLRNEIGHCKKTNDLELYHKLGSEITQKVISNIIKVIIDVLNNKNRK